jgi:ParB-like chromosome segregation protein Spo0J
MFNTEPTSIRLQLNRLDSHPAHRSFSRPLTAVEHQTLRASIESAGCVLQPIIVQYVQAKSKYEVIDGYNRWGIADVLGHVDIPCIQVFTEQQRLEALMANATRRQLTPDERDQLLAKGRTAFVNSALQLIPELRGLYERGELAKILGPANVLYLTNASEQKQQELYHKIQHAFSTPLPSSTASDELNQQITSLSAQITSMQRTTTQLESDLEATHQEKHTLQEKLDLMTKDLDLLADKKAGNTKRTLEQQVATLSDKITKLSVNLQTASSKTKVLEEQLKTAESEKKAAQIYARTAEQKAQTAQQRLASPQIVSSNFESIHKLIEAIKAQIVAAKPLANEDDKLIQGHISQTQTLLTDLTNTLQSVSGELIPFQRHLKPKSARGETSNAQAN